MLLASSPSMEQLKESIARFYCTTFDRIDVHSKVVYVGGKRMSTEVTQKKGRFQFTYKEQQDETQAL